MYFNNSNNFFHGIMFHHFHDDNLHSKGQGSISKDDFYSLIKFIGRKNILDADIFFEKLKKNQLKANEVCLTFDDAVKCQIDIALPVLEDLKIKSFFFVYTSLFSNDPDNLEVFRFFRMNYYNHINDFYDDFYVKLDQDLKSFFLNYEKEMNYKKRKSPHYSIEDIKFRFVRDVFLKKEKYNEIMFSMMIDKNFEPKKFYNKLFFNNQDLKNLNSLGHLVGLHSHTHPTLFESLNYDNQQIEYEKALSVLCKILNKTKKEIKWMSHPNGSYNLDTLEILKNLGIELGFKQIMAIEPEKGMKKINNSRLEIARENHSAIMKRMI